MATRSGLAAGGRLEQSSEQVTRKSGTTGRTTIVTFLMVFLIERSQNKDALAMHIKLNELVAAMKGASNRLIDVESLSERELAVLERHYGELARLAAADANVTRSHSVEEARSRHVEKARR